jgi:hypothetical protein
MALLLLCYPKKSLNKFYIRNSYKKAEFGFLKNYFIHDKKIVDSLLRQNKPTQLSNYYKKQLDSLTKSIIKQKSISKALTTENGQFITIEDGGSGKSFSKDFDSTFK